MIMKQSPATLGFLLVLVLLTVGCSAFHEVTVVSHGEEVAAVETPVLPVIVSTSPTMEPEKVDTPSPLAPPINAIPSTPPMVLPSAKDSSAKDIFAQSAEDSTLPWTLQDVFFDYDQMTIRRDAIPILEQNAKVVLKRYANRQVLIQGHCDERGTEAYNFILGERRATAVKNYFVSFGVDASQLRVLSLGKSQPFCQERTISCLQQNRRAHFVLK
jgi:peptidoglycan-associated lipoprotein